MRHRGNSSLKGAYSFRIIVKGLQGSKTEPTNKAPWRHGIQPEWALLSGLQEKSFGLQAPQRKGQLSLLGSKDPLFLGP